MREVCGAVSGMCMVAGLETGSSKKMDHEGKKYNYEVVQRLSAEFKDISGSIICRELLGLDQKKGIEAASYNATPEPRDTRYYKTRPCVQLVRDAVEILELSLYEIEVVAVTTPEQVQEVASLAKQIWQEHYEPIIGQEQVNYMVDKFQSVPAMQEQLEQKGYQYYGLIHMGKLAGYFAIKEEKDELFLSKLYIDKKYRGRDYARKALNYIEQTCIEKGIRRLWLTVNRNNHTSIRIYEKLGFSNAGSQVADIGSGYVMDDYIMEKYFSK